MSLFDLPVEEYEPPEVVPEGEYDLQIHAADEGTAQTGRPMLTIQLKVLNPPSEIHNPSLIWHRVFGVLVEDPPNTRNALLGNGAAFCQVFGVETPINVMALPGLTGSCLVIVEDDQNGVPRNALKLPRVKR